MTAPTDGYSTYDCPYPATVAARGQGRPTNQVELVNGIAAALGHGMALTAGELAGIADLRALQAAWRAKGEAGNAEGRRALGDLWIAGAEGWSEVDDESGYRLIWTTGSGRLTVTAEQDTGETWLEFRAGPDPFAAATGNAAGRTAAIIAFDFHGEGGALRAHVEHLDDALLVGRPDRIDLLRRIDERWGGRGVFVVDGDRETWLPGPILDAIAAAANGSRLIDALAAPYVWASRVTLSPLTGVGYISDDQQASLFATLRTYRGTEFADLFEARVEGMSFVAVVVRALAHKTLVLITEGRRPKTVTTVVTTTWEAALRDALIEARSPAANAA